MLRKILIRAMIVLGVLGVVGWAYVAEQERKADSRPLIARVQSLPVPADLVFVDEWSHDGDWLIKPRPAQASRTYLSAGSLQEVCERLDGFYSTAGVDLREVASSRSDYDGCDRRLDFDGEVWIWIEPASEWMVETYAADSTGPMVRVQYVAYGR